MASQVLPRCRLSHLGPSARRASLQSSAASAQARDWTLSAHSRAAVLCPPGSPSDRLCTRQLRSGPSPSPCPPRTLWLPSMSQRHSDSSLEEKLLGVRFHSELQLDDQGNPESRLPMVRGPLWVQSNAAFQPDSPGPQPASPKDRELRTVVLSTDSPAALKMGTEQLIPRSLAVSSKAKTPGRHQSFGAAVLSKEAARRDLQLHPAPSFSLDDMDLDVGPGGTLARNLRSQSYRAAMRGLRTPGGEVGAVHLSPKLQALAEEATQPPARHPAKNKVGGLCAWTAGRAGLTSAAGQ